MPFILHQPVLLVQSDADGTGAVVDGAGAGMDDDTSVKKRRINTNNESLVQTERYQKQFKNIH